MLSKTDYNFLKFIYYLNVFNEKYFLFSLYRLITNITASSRVIRLWLFRTQHSFLPFFFFLSPPANWMDKQALRVHSFASGNLKSPVSRYWTCTTSKILSIRTLFFYYVFGQEMSKTVEPWPTDIKGSSGQPLLMLINRS